MLLHLTNTDNKKNLSIIQGVCFGLDFYIRWFNVSNWLYEGHIRRLYKDDIILAQFNFDSIRYGRRDGRDGYWTIISAYLTPEQTSSLPVLPNRHSIYDKAKPGINTLVYDITMRPPDNPDYILKLIDYSFVEVIPEVTR